LPGPTNQDIGRERVGALGVIRGEIWVHQMADRGKGDSQEVEWRGREDSIRDNDDIGRPRSSQTHWLVDGRHASPDSDRNRFRFGQTNAGACFRPVGSVPLVGRDQ